MVSAATAGRGVPADRPLAPESWWPADRGPRTVSGSPGLPADVAPSLACPLQRCSDASLKLIVIFLAVTDRAALEGALCCAPRCTAARKTGEVTQACLAAARHDPYFPGILEGLLCSRLRRSAERYRGRCLFELANIWSREQATLRGHELVALLWMVSCHPCSLYRKLEAVITRRIEEGGRWALLDEGDDLLAS